MQTFQLIQYGMGYKRYRKLFQDNSLYIAPKGHGDTRTHMVIFRV